MSDVLLFAANDETHGLELWRSDGTTEGTWRLTDACPGDCPSLAASLRPLPGGAFFLADDGAHGMEPWVSDGTREGTRLLVDVRPGRQGSWCGGAGAWWSAEAQLFFWADDGRRGCELWRTNGTEEGTRLVFEDQAGPAHSLTQNGLGTVDDLMVFGGAGRLLRSDGTEGGTRQIASVDTVHYGAATDPPRALFGRLYFPAGDSLHGVEPWSTDGTAAGTGLLGDLRPGVSSSQPGGWEPCGDRVCFLTNSQSLWRTNGTPGGTEHLLTLDPGLRLLDALGTLGDRQLFTGSTQGSGCELWSSDGTAAGTGMVVEIGPGAASGVDCFPYHATTRDGRLLFRADDGVHGGELWVSDGTAAGTAMVADLSPGAATSLPSSSFWGGLLRTRFSPLADGSVLFFANTLGVGFAAWRSDGSSPGTRLVRDVLVQGSSLFSEIRPIPLRLSTGRTTFFARVRLGSTLEDPATVELWATDGRAAWPILVPEEGDLVTGGFPGSAWSWDGNHLLFAVHSREAGGAVPWITDGEPEQSVPLSLLTPLLLDYGFDGAWPVGNGSLLNAIRLATWDDPAVWFTDGTSTGTWRLPAPANATAVAETTPNVLLTGTSLDHQPGLWRLGPGGDLELIAAPPADDLSWPPRHLVADSDVAFFTATSADAGRELWRTDGSSAGTGPMPDLNPGPSSSIPADGFWSTRGSGSAIDTFAASFYRMLALDQRVFYAADDGVHGLELAVATAQGEITVLDLFPGPRSSEPTWLTRWGDRVLFVAEHPRFGRELWTSDGTLEGSRVLVDIAPGLDSAHPQWLTLAGDRLWFSATDRTHGVELWSSDGSAAGTAIFQDIHPGPGPSSPLGLAGGDGLLFFYAADGVHGFEPWVVDLALLFTDGFETGDTRAWTRSGIQSPLGLEHRSVFGP